MDPIGTSGSCHGEVDVITILSRYYHPWNITG